jgi:2-aminoethylphosphonate-pyruvate transaminase
MNIKRKVLFNPGPATTSLELKYSLMVEDICPREREFSETLDLLRIRMLEIVRADNDKYSCIPFSGSGTLVMDVCINSLVPSSFKILLLNNGSYAHRAVDICRSYSIDFVEIKSDSRKSFDFGLLKNIDLSEVRIVYLTHHETGTGVLNNIEEFSRIAKENNWITIVDTISSYAMIPIDLNKLDLDFIMTSSQKGIGGFAGLSFVIGKHEIINESKNYPRRSYYNNLYQQYSSLEKSKQFPFTPPVQIVYSSLKAAEMLLSEGVLSRFGKRKILMDKIHNYLEFLGFKEYIEYQYQSGILLSVEYPKDKPWNFDVVHDHCYSEGFTIYPGKTIGQDTFRLSVFGDLFEEDIDRFFSVFKEALEVCKNMIKQEV